MLLRPHLHAMSRAGKPTQKQISGCQGWEGRREVTANGQWSSLRGDGHALELDPCDGSTTVLKLNSVLYGKEYYAI